MTLDNLRAREAQLDALLADRKLARKKPAMWACLYIDRDEVRELIAEASR